MKGDSRSRRLLAVLMSVLVHGALLVALRQAPPVEVAKAVSASSEPISIEVMHQPTEPVVPLMPGEPPRSTVKQKRHKRTVRAEVLPPSGNDSSDQAHSDVPLAADPEPSLIPKGYVQPGQRFSGTTIYPSETPIDPHEESKRSALLAGERVQGWAEDNLAEARALAGGSPYHKSLRAALDGLLQTSDAGTPLALGVDDGNAGVKHAYEVAAGTYGRTGNPGFAPPGAAPTMSELLARNHGQAETPEDVFARTYAHAAETRASLANGAPLLTLKFELRQSPHGELLATKLLESSGNLRFDAFVIRSVPDALKLVTVSDSPGNKPLRSVFQVDGWLPKPDTIVDEVLDSSPLGIVKPLVDQLTPRSSAQMSFVFRTKLLRVY